MNRNYEKQELPVAAMFVNGSGQNEQKKKEKKTNNDLQNIHIKLKIGPHSKTAR
jgi:hypothetical protein